MEMEMKMKSVICPILHRLRFASSLLAMSILKLSSKLQIALIRLDGVDEMFVFLRAMSNVDWLGHL